MARIRTIKPDFFKDEKLTELSHQKRLFFQGLWLLADREGRLEERPKFIKAEIFPYEEFSIDSALEELCESGFLIRYDVEGKKYIQIKNFLKHQRPNKREAQSTIPAYEEKRNSRKRKFLHVQDCEIQQKENEKDDQDHVEGNKEGEREGNGRSVGANAPTPSPEEFLEDLKSDYPGLNLEVELGKMRAWMKANPGKRQLTKRFMVNWLNRVDRPLNQDNLVSRGGASAVGSGKYDHVWEN